MNEMRGVPLPRGAVVGGFSIEGKGIGVVCEARVEEK